ncbi:DUF6221 family protein [Streptomyces sp. NPDC023838]|uniref:DUF6221 family protein n=1 Tax=Streptomyces sp. NPDC023838 TaxID=3154325 RepID=UPI0033F467F6
MDDLVQFLRDRLDEDERAAHAAPGPSWERREIRDHDGSFVFEEYVAVADPGRNKVVLSDVDAEVLPFVLRHDPARVLAEVDAKRQLVARVENHALLMGRDEIHGDLLRLLALPYAGHPDYREEWRP